MSDYEIKLDVDPKDKYQKAWKALVEAEKAFSDLEPQEQHRLAENYFKEKVCTHCLMHCSIIGNKS